MASCDIIWHSAIDLDSMSFLWTLNNVPTSETPIFDISHGNTKWQLIMNQSYQDIVVNVNLYLMLREKRYNQIVVADFYLNIMNNSGNIMLKKRGLVLFQDSDCKIKIDDTSYQKASWPNSTFKIHFIITQKSIQNGMLNFKYSDPFTDDKQDNTDDDEQDNTDEDIILTKTLVKDLDSLLTSPKFSDFVVKVDDKNIAVHKSILASRSSVFCAMLDNDFSENNRGYLEIKDMDKDIVFSFIRFLYTSKVTISNVDEAQKLFAAADKYDVSDLKNLCEKYILDKMDVSNVVKILIFTDCHNADHIKARAVRYATDKYIDLDDAHIDILLENTPRLFATLMKEVKKK